MNFCTMLWRRKLGCSSPTSEWQSGQRAGLCWHRSACLTQTLQKLCLQLRTTGSLKMSRQMGQVSSSLSPAIASALAMTQLRSPEGRLGRESKLNEERKRNKLHRSAKRRCCLLPLAREGHPSPFSRFQPLPATWVRAVVVSVLRKKKKKKVTSYV